MTRAARPWTEAEKALLRKVYPTMPMAEMIVLFGRSKLSIQGKAEHLGLHKRIGPCPALVTVGEAMPTIHADGRVRATKYHGGTMLPGSRVRKAQWTEDAPATALPTVVKAKGLAAGIDPRYQTDPSERPFGAGFAAVGVGFDVTTGRAW